MDGEDTEYVEILIVGNHYLSYLKAITLENRKSFNIMLNMCILFMMSTL